MAKKIEYDLRKNPLKPDLYPWLRLLELEVTPKELPKVHRGKGRPRNPFPRKSVHVTLTEDELAVLDDLCALLSDGLGTRLHRGHVIAFLVFYLRSRLEDEYAMRLPEEVSTLSDLAKYLDQIEVT